jgi:DNA-binding NarL/FixJ family response regulator
MNVNTSDYQHRASQHRSVCEHCLRRDVLILAGRGLTERDIAESLRTDPATVRRMLTEEQ